MSYEFRDKDTGFTLLEIMIALAIIGLTVSVILHTVNRHADILYENTIDTLLYQTAKEKIYQLEKSLRQSKGRINENVYYENRVKKSRDSDVIRLETIVKGYDRQVTLTELVVIEDDSSVNR